MRTYKARTVYFVQVVLYPCGFARLHGLLTPLWGEGETLGGQVARPCVFELAPLIALAVHLAGRMNPLRTDAEAAPAAPAATTAAAQQDGQRIFV